MTLTEAQKRAVAKYNENNRERTNYIKNRSAAKSFINTKANIEDLEHLKELIKRREAALNGEVKE